ncbi:MAG: EscU/YscU/HrcU family type III secretion system export apparatus switch protein [Deltaproteobacteria bacterium]|nr:EscU/YscU/HrcU family type III secretion system export apparatus switch protein [Deltaproteobacteria bacterium]
MSDDKTEEASPRRLEQAREKGQVAQSRDAVALAALVAGLGALSSVSGSIDESFRRAMSLAVRAAASPESPRVGAALQSAFESTVRVSASVLGAACVGAAVVGALMTGFLFSPSAGLPSLDRLDPSAALGKYAKLSTYVEPAISLLKGLLAVALGLDAARAMVGLWARASGGSVTLNAALMNATLRGVVTRMLALVAAFAVLDVLYRKWKHGQELRMSKDEVKREHKESDGNAETKHERDRLHKELAQEATMAEVRRAQFVVTNPTHYAAAMAWDAELMDAPRLVAKGEGDLAQRMIAEAHRAGVPVLRSPPLARALHELEPGEDIPEVLFDAVAAVVRHLTSGAEPEAFVDPDE